MEKYIVFTQECFLLLTVRILKKSQLVHPEPIFLLYVIEMHELIVGRPLSFSLCHCNTTTGVMFACIAAGKHSIHLPCSVLRDIKVRSGKRCVFHISCKHRSIFQPLHTELPPSLFGLGANGGTRMPLTLEGGEIGGCCNIFFGCHTGVGEGHSYFTPAHALAAEHPEQSKTAGTYFWLWEGRKEVL